VIRYNSINAMGNSRRRDRWSLGFCFASEAARSAGWAAQGPAPEKYRPTKVEKITSYPEVPVYVYALSGGLHCMAMVRRLAVHRNRTAVSLSAVSRSCFGARFFGFQRFCIPTSAHNGIPRRLAMGYMEDLLRAIRGAGAFQRFKDSLRQHGIESGWFTFRTEALRQIALSWCEENQIVWE
jgi:hypothetical protein